MTSTGGSNENKGEFGDADEDMEDTEASEMNDRMKKVRDSLLCVHILVYNSGAGDIDVTIKLINDHPTPSTKSYFLQAAFMLKHPSLSCYPSDYPCYFFHATVSLIHCEILILLAWCGCFLQICLPSPFANSLESYFNVGMLEFS